MRTWEIVVLLMFALFGVVMVLARAAMRLYPVDIRDVIPEAIGGAIGGLVLGLIFISIVSIAKAIKGRWKKKTI